MPVPASHESGPERGLEQRFRGLITAGDHEEAARLLDEHFAPVLARKLSKLALALGGGDEAEHLASWAIATAVAKGELFDPRRGSLASWIFWLGRNLALSQQRKLRPGAGLRGDLEARSRTVESRLRNSEAFQRVLARIPGEVHRRVLFLDLAHHGQAPGALCGELGLDRATFYKRRCEARRLFREAWNEAFGDPSGSFYGELE